MGKVIMFPEPAKERLEACACGWRIPKRLNALVYVKDVSGKSYNARALFKKDMTVHVDFSCPECGTPYTEVLSYEEPVT